VVGPPSEHERSRMQEEKVEVQGRPLGNASGGGHVAEDVGETRRGSWWPEVGLWLAGCI